MYGYDLTRVAEAAASSLSVISLPADGVQCRTKRDVDASCAGHSSAHAAYSAAAAARQLQKRKRTLLAFDSADKDIRSEVQGDKVVIRIKQQRSGDDCGIDNDSDSGSVCDGRDGNEGQLDEAEGCGGVVRHAADKKPKHSAANRKLGRVHSDDDADAAAGWNALVPLFKQPPQTQASATRIEAKQHTQLRAANAPVGSGSTRAVSSHSASRDDNSIFPQIEQALREDLRRVVKCPPYCSLQAARLHHNCHKSY